MSVTGVDRTVHPAPTQRRSDSREAFDRFKPGQHIDVFVQERLGAQTYLMRFAGSQHIVETAMSLTAGATFAATVVAVGDKLELKVVPPEGGSTLRGAAVQECRVDPEDPHGELLEQTAEQFAVTLSDSDHVLVAAAMRDVAEPLDMARSALFLSKTDRQIETGALQAVYTALAWRDDDARTSAADLATEAAGASDADIHALALELQQRFSEEIRQPLADAPGDSDDRDRQRLARELLNASDDDALAYAYGTLPVMVADQLVELDVVLFRDRQEARASHAMRKLVMTLQTENLGRVEVMAQALGTRLTISIKAENAEASAALAAQADEVRELVSHLGWHVEAIDYGTDPLRTRAAREIVAHVLQSGSIDRLV